MTAAVARELVRSEYRLTRSHPRDAHPGLETWVVRVIEVRPFGRSRVCMSYRIEADFTGFVYPEGKLYPEWPDTIEGLKLTPLTEYRGRAIKSLGVAREAALERAQVLAGAVGTPIERKDY